MISVVLKVTVDELVNRPEFAALAAAYASESKHKLTPKPNVEFDVYRRLEEMNVLSVFAAFESGALVGFITLALIPSPRFGVQMGTVESFYVDPDHRKFGTGKRLLETVENYAMGKGAVGITVSAPSEGRLVKALPVMGYTETNRIFYKGVQ